MVPDCFVYSNRLESTLDNTSFFSTTGYYKKPLLDLCKLKQINIWFLKPDFFKVIFTIAFVGQMCSLIMLTRSFILPISG